MAKSPQDKLLIKRAALVTRTAAALNISEVEATLLLGTPRTQSLRINPLTDDPSKTLSTLKSVGWSGAAIDWSANGYTIKEGLQSIKNSELFDSGKIYIQNAASWLPVLALDPQPDETILDICAAPGGKTSHIAAMTNDAAIITANDNSRPRLAKLQANLTRLGVTNVNYTLFDATQLTRKLEGDQFDKIMLDAPCSGEGMMTLNSDKDFSSWSVAHIKRLEQLQRRILTQAWQLLKPGGTLVYSTCTMAPEENEAVIDYALRHNSDMKIEAFEIELPNRVSAVKQWNSRTFSDEIDKAMRLKPSKYVEAFFVCKITKLLPQEAYKS